MILGFWDIYLLAGGAGIFNSRIGSFLGLELWRAGWLGGLFIVVGPGGGRISTAVDCSRVLNVNRSLYSSSFKSGRAQRDVLRAQRARLYAAPTCTTGEAPVYVYCLYGSTTRGLHGPLFPIL